MFPRRLWNVRIGQFVERGAATLACRMVSVASWRVTPLPQPSIISRTLSLRFIVLAHVASYGRWCHRSALERRGFGCLGSLGAAEGGKSGVAYEGDSVSNFGRCRYSLVARGEVSSGQGRYERLGPWGDPEAI
jgi:hypothetical protein